MKKKDWLIIFLIIIFYLTLLFVFKNKIFTYKFNANLIELYFRSQDIPHEVKGRVFLSDEEIHIAAGYLYLSGYEPTKFNFQHPPLIKYFYGLSILFLKNPYFAQILLGIGYLFLTYYLGRKTFKNKATPIVACILMAIDPLFLDVSSQALLDLGQAFFSLLYLITFIFFPKNFILQGISLGLFASSKFWAPVLFFVAVLVTYKYFIRKEKKLKTTIFSFLLAFFIFSLTYLKTFIDFEGKFNIIFYQLKILKYWLKHSITSAPFSSLILFLAGYFKTWWGKKEIIRSNIWSPTWPLSFISSIVGIIKNKKNSHKIIIFLIPLLYIFYIGFQAPFTRYFLIILPYLYLGLSDILFRMLRRWRRLKLF